MSKKSFLAGIAILAIMLGGASAALAGLAPGTGVVDSKHDMNVYLPANGGAADTYGRVCAFCHTPHHAVEDVNADYMPLWSRTVTAQTFQGYIDAGSGTLDAVYTAAADPVSGPSRLCMSCHDGVVAIDAYYGFGGTAALVEGDAFGEIGVAFERSLMNDHPIGFDYPTVAAGDAEINPETTMFIGGTKLISDVLYPDGSGNQVMTCATCHDVHQMFPVE